MNKTLSADRDHPQGPEPRLKPPGFGQDCAVGDKLQLRCLAKAIGEYLYARRGAREMWAICQQVVKTNPGLGRKAIMVRVGMQWLGVREADSAALLEQAQDSFGEWPSHHEITFRNFVVYLLVTEYLRTRCATGTQLDLQRLVAKWVPE